MNNLYIAVFQRMYRWSAKQEFDKQPSLYSATLYFSTLQLFNLLSIYFLIASLGIARPSMSGWHTAAVSGVLLILNAFFGRKYEEEIRGTPLNRPIAKWYLALSAVAFVVTFVLFVATSPST